MAKRSKEELLGIKEFVDLMFNDYGRMLIVNESPGTIADCPNAYCVNHKNPTTGNSVYKIVAKQVGHGKDYTDFRVLMHEYGHIYLNHLDGIHEELDYRINYTIKNKKDILIREINEACGIDYAELLLDRVIDDPQLNHSLHNIAMDMEVNSSVLSDEDIDEMEADFTELMEKEIQEMKAKGLLPEDYDPYDDNEVKDEEETTEEGSDYTRKKDSTPKYGKASQRRMVKLILPKRFNLGFDVDGKPIEFPSNLTYVEYAILIINHLDQFVKMLVSINMGGNGDTSKVSGRDIQNVMNNPNKNWKNKSEEYKNGYNDALNDALNDLIEGYSNDEKKNDQNQSNQSGQPQDQNKNGQGQNQNQNGGQQPGQTGENTKPGPNRKGKGGKGKDPGKDGDKGDGGDPAPYGGIGKPSETGNGPANNPCSGNSNSEPQGKDNKPGGQQQSGQGDPQQEDKNSGSGTKPAGRQHQPDPNNSTDQQREDYENGYNDALNDLEEKKNGPDGGDPGNTLDKFLSKMGMSERKESKYKGKTRPEDDHDNDSRDSADRKRETKELQNSNAFGCGNSGAPENLLNLTNTDDNVEMALKEVMRNLRKRVIKFNNRKDVMKLYNKGVVRSVIAPTISNKVSIKNENKIVYLIDVSGSMDTALINRILSTIAKSMKKLSRGLRYDIITWSTELGENIKDIDPRKGVPSIHSGGGTRIAKGIQYFKDNYGPESVLIVISDFEDYLEEWVQVENTMKEYTMYGFNYGTDDVHTFDWKYMKIRDFSRN